MKYVIVDIDGTIANGDHRVHFLHQDEKDWDAYFSACDKDKPIQEMIDLVKALDKSGAYEFVLCTGRREEERMKTKRWILDSFWPEDAFDIDEFDDKNLLMRKNGDFRHDTLVKPELLEEAGIRKENIAFILEDRNSMVEHWRSMGIKCLQVAIGDF